MGGRRTTVTAWPTGAFKPSNVALRSAIFTVDTQAATSRSSNALARKAASIESSITNLHAERAALILLAVLLNRILIDDRLHLLDCHAVRVGEHAFGLARDQITLPSSFGHEASVLGGRVRRLRS
jgi:hypothetical protein